MSEYPKHRLMDVGVALHDCVHATPTASSEGYPYIAIPDIIDGRIDISRSRRITEADYLKWTAKLKPEQGDLVVTRRGRVGDTAPVPYGIDCAIGQNLVILRSDGIRINQRFLRWALRGPDYQSEVQRLLNVGAVFNSLNCRDIPEIVIPVPPLPEQQAIAEVLGALDDKIELNRRMNATLEELARTIFRSWFVDFDPVHAKAESRAPFGMDAATAALFPDTFVPSELGDIPAGWGVSTVGEAFEIVGGSTPSTKRPEFWEPPVHTWTTPKDLSGDKSPVLLGSERQISDAGLATISSGLLPEGTLLMSSRAPIGYLAINDVPTAINQGFIAMKQRQMLPTHYGLFWAQHNMDAIKARANGSTFMEISKSSFRPILILVPEPDVIDAFNGLFWPLWERLVLNLKESKTLAELRDTLLPKLLSGEITVQQAKREVVGAT